jgi:hypothetical protein
VLKDGKHENNEKTLGSHVAEYRQVQSETSKTRETRETRTHSTALCNPNLCTIFKSEIFIFLSYNSTVTYKKNETTVEHIRYRHDGRDADRVAEAQARRPGQG